MSIDDLISDLLGDPAHFDKYTALLRCWVDDEVSAYVESRKQAADDHWSVDPNVSLDHANVIIGIGHIREENAIVALGMMARGDALKLLGRAQEAWDTLEQAGELYLSVGDDVGWGRTRIGRLYICADLNKVDQALAESQQARAIFVRHGEHVRAFRLDLNTAYFYTRLGDHRRALEVYLDALDTAEDWGAQGRPYLGILYGNLGYVYSELGDLRLAAEYHQFAYDAYREQGDTLHVASAQFNLAHLATLQGRYRSALHLLHSVEMPEGGEFPVEYVIGRSLLLTCYLLTGRFQEAREQARDLLERCHAANLRNETGYILMSLAEAEAELGHFDAALQALDDARALFTYINAESWVANVRLKRGQIALKQGDWQTALREAAAVAEYFQSVDEQVSHANAVLLHGQAAAAAENWLMAARAARTTLNIARQRGVPALAYSSHLLLGQVAEAQGERQQAVRRYAVATRTVERMQRDLTVTLRPGFLESRQGALRGLMRLYLEDKQAECAFETLERTKSQALLSHLSNRESLRWLPDERRSRPLIDELERLRQDYHLYEQVAHGTSALEKTGVGGMSREAARCALVACEQRMRAITEQLYLFNDSVGASTHPPELDALRTRVADGEALLEFYNDGTRLWVFILDARGLRLHALSASAREFEVALREFEFTRDTSISLSAYKSPDSPEMTQLGALLRDSLRQLYRLLLEPIAAHVRDYRRLVVVPFGALHYLPFHLLHTGAEYLIEQQEVVVLPTAALRLATRPSRPRGGLVLAHDGANADGANDTLLHALAEGRGVADVLGAPLYCNDQAERGRLKQPPRQVLHIAAHGKYRIDQPDFSCIYLGDGPLWSDDLFQHDLSYELVTLSACETGRAKAVSGDELIGLGRGFLYAGAGALIASLWRVDDSLTLDLMRHLYRALLKPGVSKSAALRQAQCDLLADRPGLNPAYWGAFQLIGSADPLSVENAIEGTSHHDE